MRMHVAYYCTHYKSQLLKPQDTAEHCTMLLELTAFVRADHNSRVALRVITCQLQFSGISFCCHVLAVFHHVVAFLDLE